MRMSTIKETKRAGRQLNTKHSDATDRTQFSNKNERPGKTIIQKLPTQFNHKEKRPGNREGKPAAASRWLEHSPQWTLLLAQDTNERLPWSEKVSSPLEPLADEV